MDVWIWEYGGDMFIKIRTLRDILFNKNSCDDENVYIVQQPGENADIEHLICG